MWAPTSHLNPALGLRAIRWSLADPSMFRNQLRAVLRAAAYGKVKLLFPMLAHVHEIEQTLAQVELARAELDARGVPYGPVELGAMIEVPAAALMVRSFLKYFDFLSIGTPTTSSSTPWPLTGPTKPWPICMTPCTRPCCAWWPT